ncbi:beta-glucosidase [Bacteroides reticulotermitis]|uniref:Beta-glucosidase n=2 Tax=Bacteroides reticulotermitis TaxID=1133319 RepID=W4UMW5_9BACE|nr:hypothetical protein [Bacteroides reticulotermitis]MBB4043385.1 beta-glucosidase [Bacteroides reticulotermitis]GAE81879.1 beta-glucosidase [Bacteroides reticulotermitis JCM 10512]
MNIFRDPCWGRGQETYGEELYLSARMGGAVVKGFPMSFRMFPFGHGLSYTQFSYGKILLSVTKLQAGNEQHIKLPIKNIGNYKGNEILQIYIQKLGDKDTPIKT